jgi:Curlin associated repeat
VKISTLMALAFAVLAQLSSPSHAADATDPSVSVKASYSQLQEDLISAYLKSASAGGVGYTGLIGDNAANVSQLHDGNTAIISQYGNLNTAYIGQSAGTNNLAMISQTGVGNTASITQAASNNLALIIQH